MAYNGSNPNEHTIQHPIRREEFDGKRALVTGGTKGIGEAIAKRLIRSGATVISTARSTPAEAKAPGLFVQADLSSAEGVEAVVKEVNAQFGGVDILVNNVGGSSAPSGGVSALSDVDWQQTFDANLFFSCSLGSSVASVDAEKGSWRDHPHFI